MIRLTMVSLALAALALAGAPAALAAPTDDFRAVLADWQPDHDVTACRFTRAQLVNADAVAGTLADFDSYAPGFRDEVRREIARYDAGGCRGVSPDSPARARSPLAKLRITKIRPKGGLRESVTIRNAGAGSVRLSRATLRDRGGHRVRLGNGRLGARRSLRVFTGCARGHRKAYRRGSRLYACLRRRVWDDRGDLVKVVDGRGVTVAQRGYGRLRRLARF